MKKYVILLIILLIPFVLLSETNVHTKYGLPGMLKWGQIIYREGYVLLMDYEKKVPLWVSYHLTAQDLKGKQKRVDKFRPDPLIPNEQRAELSDYKKSGYDRGHMAPSGDMKRSYKVMLDSFYLSNSPNKNPPDNPNPKVGSNLIDACTNELKTIKNSIIIINPEINIKKNDNFLLLILSFSSLNFTFMIKFFSY